MNSMMFLADKNRFIWVVGAEQKLFIPLPVGSLNIEARAIVEFVVAGDTKGCAV